MVRVSRAWDRLISTMALLAGLLMAVVTVLVLVDVVLRNVGVRPWPHTFTITEFSMLYITLLAAPWLVRERGNIFVEFLVMLFPPVARRRLDQLVIFCCGAACAVLAWYALQTVMLSYERSDILVVSFDAPRWLVMSIMPLAFVMMAIEFFRTLLTNGTIYQEFGGNV